MQTFRILLAEKRRKVDYTICVLYYGCRQKDIRLHLMMVVNTQTMKHCREEKYIKPGSGGLEFAELKKL